MEEYVSPDGLLSFLVIPGPDGDISLGFAGCPWHTHADILAAMYGLPEAEAVRQFMDKLLSGVSVIVVLLLNDEVKDIWVSDDPGRDISDLQMGESVIVRYWDGRKWMN